MDRDICPICGGKLSSKIYYNNPPTRSRKCLKCGRKQEIFNFDDESFHYNQLRNHIPKLAKRMNA